MNIYIKDNGHEQHARLLQKGIEKKIDVTCAENGLHMELCIDSALEKKDSFLITHENDGWKIIGADESGLYYGIGKFLHTAKWTENNFVPNPPQELMAPACSFRAMYFAVHLYNWYANAPTQELEAYLEELLLWGYNAIVLIIPVIDIYSFEDKLYKDAVSKSRAIFSLAKKLGMQVGIIICPNQGLLGAPHEWDADPSFDPIGNVRGNAGRNICPAIPEALEYLKDIWTMMFRQYTDIGLDYIVTWPYDEGGCGCEKCRPWGARGYGDVVNVLHDEAVKFYPNAKFIVSAWIFDKPDDQGEYEGLYQRLKGDLSWVDYIMIDAHEDFPRYPLEHEIVKPIVNFPEISMWKLYPWGGYGATPLAERFHGIWNSAKHILDGGMPYSEGMYEDISKVQFAGYYWEPERDYKDILAEYANYEFRTDVVKESLEIMDMIEKNHVLTAAYQEPDIEGAIRAGELAEAVQKRLGQKGFASWRWRILYIRALIDQKKFEYYRDHNMSGRYDTSDIRNFAGDFLAEDESAQVLFKELRKWYHSVEYNGRNQFTLPVVGGGTQFGYEGTLETLRAKREEKNGGK